MSNNKYAFGIDLGTTNSALAFYAGGVPETVMIDGAKTMPSVVWYHPDGTTTVGSVAYDRKGAKDVVYSSKRDMGTDTVYHLVLEDGSEKDVTPIDVATEVLKAIISKADKRYGVINEATITVPAYFNQKQRTATRIAAERAGLKVVSIINEPTAAALAYGVNRELNTVNTILVVDVGGGTTDVTLINVSNYENDDKVPKCLRGLIKSGLDFDIISTGGNNHLGGDDYDNSIIDFAKQRLINKSDKDNKLYLTKNFTHNRYRHLVEMWKQKYPITQLSVTCTDIESGEKRNYVFEEDDCKRAFEVFWNTINKCIDDTMIIRKDDGSEMVYSDPIVCIPVGGSTKNPMLLEAIKKRFSSTDIQIPSPVFADESIALGASVACAIAKGSVTDISFKEVNPIPIGISATKKDGNTLINGCFAQVIGKDVPLPVSKTFGYATAVDNQEVLSIKVYQGFSSFVSGNELLGTLIVEDLPQGKAGEVEIEITFDVSVDGILTVTAKSGDKVLSAKMNSVLNSASRTYTPMEERALQYMKTVRIYMEAVGDVGDKDYNAVCNWLPGDAYPEYSIKYRKEISNFVRHKIVETKTSVFDDDNDDEE